MRACASVPRQFPNNAPHSWNHIHRLCVFVYDDVMRYATRAPQNRLRFDKYAPKCMCERRARSIAVAWLPELARSGNTLWIINDDIQWVQVRGVN